MSTGRRSRMLVPASCSLRASVCFQQAGTQEPSRALRAAIGAFERRGDVFRAGDAEMKLGRLQLARGRAAEARLLFESAHDRFQRVRAPMQAVAATLHLGMAQTDLGLFGDAERSCRAAYSAASAAELCGNVIELCRGSRADSLVAGEAHGFTGRAGVRLAGRRCRNDRKVLVSHRQAADCGRQHGRGSAGYRAGDGRPPTLARRQSKRSCADGRRRSRRVSEMSKR